MPIDASIIGGLRAPTPIALEDPISQYAKGLQLKTLMGQNELQGLQTQQAQESLADTSAARDTYKASINPQTGEVDRSSLLRNLAGKGAIGAFTTAQKSFQDADKAKAELNKANAETLHHKIEAYKALSQSANSPEEYAPLVAAQWNDPDVGPIMRARGGTLQDALSHIPTDPAKFSEFKVGVEKGMAGVQENLQKQREIASRERGQNMTFASSNYGHQVTQQGNEAKQDPLGLGIAPAGNVPQPPVMPPSALPGGAGQIPGNGMSPSPVVPPAGPRFDRNAPELPAMRAAVAGTDGPPADTLADLQAARQGLVTAKTPASRQAYQELVGYLEKTVGQGAASGVGGNTAAGGVSAPIQAPAAAPSGPIDLAQHGDDLLKQLPPGIASQVKALAEGRMAFPTGAAFRSPATQQILSLVGAYDPSFDAVNYQARNKTRSSLAAGQIGQNLTKINTAIGHLDSFDKAAQALNNSDYPLFNRLFNSIAPEVGGTETAGKIRTFQQAKEAVSNELMAVFRGTGASSTDTAKWAETLNSADSPTALKAAVRGAVDLLDSRIGAVTQQYQTGMGTTEEPLQMVYPKAQATLDRLRGGGKESMGAQVVDSLPDPSQYKGKFAHGNDGVSYQSDGSKWVRVKK